jgi:hypothetical protein
MLRLFLELAIPVMAIAAFAMVLGLRRELRDLAAEVQRLKGIPAAAAEPVGDEEEEMPAAPAAEPVRLEAAEPPPDAEAPEVVPAPSPAPAAAPAFARALE